MTSTSSLIGVAVSAAGNTCISLGLIIQKVSHNRLQAQDQSEASTSKLPTSPITNTTRIRRTSKTSLDEQTPLLLPTTFTSNSSNNFNKPNLNTTLADSAIITSSIQTLPNKLSTPIIVNGLVEENGRKRKTIGKRKKRRVDKAYLSSPLWWIGLSLLNLGELGNFLAYSFAPSSLVAPLGTVTLIANVFFSRIILKEKVSKRDLLGVALAIFGGITIVISSKSSDKKLFPSELLLAVKTPAFLIYSITSVSLLILLSTLSRTSYGDKYVMIDVGVCAVAGGLTVLSTKAFSSFLNLIFLETFKYLITYPILFVLLTTALIQVNFINKSLQRFDSRVVIPFQFVSFSISAIIGSAILYRDFDGITKERFLNFLFGCALSALGVYVLTLPNSSRDFSSSSSSAYPDPIPISPTSRPSSIFSPQTPKNQHQRNTSSHSNNINNGYTTLHLPITSSPGSNRGLGARTISVTLGGGQYLLGSPSGRREMGNSTIEDEADTEDDNENDVDEVV